MKRNTRARRARPNVSTAAPKEPVDGGEGEVPRGYGERELEAPAGGADQHRSASHALILAPLVGAVRDQWYQSFSHLGIPRELWPSAPPAHGLAVVTEKNLFLAGVGLYDTDGPWVLAEHLSTNPMAPPRLKHRAVLKLGSCAIAHCTALSKVPIVIVRSRGLAQTLMHLGAVQSPGLIMIGLSKVRL